MFIVFFTLKHGTSWKEKHAQGIAGLTAIIFAINPLNTETVTYISGRASGMAGFFYLLSILFLIGFYFDLTALIPAYNINLIPNFIPTYFVFVIINVAVLVAILKRKEKKHRHE